MTLEHRIRKRIKLSVSVPEVSYTGYFPVVGGKSETTDTKTNGAFGHAERCDDWSRGESWRSSNQLHGFVPWRWDDQGSKFDKFDVYVHQPAHVALHRTLKTGSYTYVWKHTGGFWFSPAHQAAGKTLQRGNVPSLPSVFKDWSDDQLNELGATAISKTRPNDPGVSVATSLGELREGIPSLVGSSMVRRPGSKSLGSEWLNYQFGILPILGDVENFATAVRDQDKILAQWYRDSGRKIRRRYTFPVENEVLSTVVETNRLLLGVSTNLHTPGTLTTTYKMSRSVWFSGAYMYHAPGHDDWKRVVGELDRVYGIIPDLETAWNLTGWSWLVDWKTNASDVIGNINAFAVDRLLLLYGYLMARSTCTVEYTWSGKVYQGSALVPATFSSRVIYVRKRRVRANPFGFGWTGEELDARKLSILAALGLSARGR